MNDDNNIPEFSPEPLNGEDVRRNFVGEGVKLSSIVYFASAAALVAGLIGYNHRDKLEFLDGYDIQKSIPATGVVIAPMEFNYLNDLFKGGTRRTVECMFVAVDQSPSISKEVAGKTAEYCLDVDRRYRQVDQNSKEFYKQAKPIQEGDRVEVDLVVRPFTKTVAVKRGGIRRR